MSVFGRSGWKRGRTPSGVIGAVVLVGLVASGCGDDGSSAATEPSMASEVSTGSTAATESSGTDATSEAATFPVTIEHRFGTTTVEEAPERIVTLGFSDQDIALAFGVVPVADREWFGERPSAVWSWAQDELGDATIEVLDGSELNYERIAGLAPDAIIASYGGLQEDEYTTLSDIAPTVAQSADHPDYGAPWQQQVRTFGSMLGEPDRAEEIVTETEDVIAEARAANPEFDDATAIFGYDFGNGEVGIYSPVDPRGRFLADLGFEVPEQVESLFGDEFFAEISVEQLELIDADVVLWVTYSAPDTTPLRDNDLYQSLPIAHEGRDIFIAETDELNGAISFSTPLSIPTAIELLVPRLTAAMDGDPATTAD